MSIIDYLQNNDKDIFSHDSVSSVESLVLAQLSYYKFEMVKANRSLKEILSQVNLSDFSYSVWNKIASQKFLIALLNNKRWSKVKYVDSAIVFDKDKEQQFTAIVFELKKGLYYISFRGTDGTFIGLKEDLNLSYMETIPSHKSAITFTQKMIRKYKGYFYLGGHSKGGNLAHYTMLFMDDLCSRRVRRADSFDGPGIQLSYINENIEMRKSKLLKLIPEHSIVGRIYEFDQDNLITIKSSSSFMHGHDPFSWIVTNGRFELCDNQSRFSNYLKATIDIFNQSLDRDTKMDFINFVYEVSKRLDTIYIVEANANLKESSKLFFKAFKNADPTYKNKWKTIAKNLGKASVKSSKVLLPKMKKTKNTKSNPK